MRRSVAAMSLAALTTLACASSVNSQPRGGSGGLATHIVWKRDGADMVLVPAGPFRYGISATQRDSLLAALGTARLPIFTLESPAQTKTLRAFYIDKYEVTNRQYARFLAATRHRAPNYWRSRLLNRSGQPVVGVGWQDARAYARWTGKRLPTEEEWEKAARGTDGRFWPWGNETSSSKYNGRAAGNLAPVEVGSYPAGASPYGAMDMAGNVYEMTTGRWSGLWAMRGGSYLNYSAYVRTMFRWAANDTTNGAQWLGFRCVVDAK